MVRGQDLDSCDDEAKKDGNRIKRPQSKALWFWISVGGLEYWVWKNDEGNGADGEQMGTDVCANPLQRAMQSTPTSN